MARTRPPTADELIAGLNRWGVKFREYPGWRTRGRPGGVVLRGGVHHHTGGEAQSNDYLTFLFVKGRPEDGIPGPLCNQAIARDGTLHLGALGRANHAGSGSSAVLAVVNNGRAPLDREMQPGPDSINGNAVYWGWEWMYDGSHEPSEAMYRTALLASAAVSEIMGWDAGHWLGHREHTRRKTDPGHVALGEFRTDLAAVMAQGPTGGDEVQQEDIDQIVERVSAAVFAGPRYADLKNAIQGLTAKFDREDAQQDGRYKRYEELFKAAKTEADIRHRETLDVLQKLTEAIGALQQLPDAIATAVRAETDRAADQALARERDQTQ